MTLGVNGNTKSRIPLFAQLPRFLLLIYHEKFLPNLAWTC